MKHPAKLTVMSVMVASLCLTACGDGTPQKATQTSSKTDVQNTATHQNAEQSNKTADTATSSTQEMQPKSSQPSTAEVSANAPTPAVAPASLEVGKQRYEQTCRVCHDAGLLSAPKPSDKAEWQKRIAQGKQVLYSHSAQGFGKMPAQANGEVGEAEVYAAVDYLLKQAGVQ